jgi:hypothetical protein
MNSHQRPSETPWRSTFPSLLACSPRLDPSELQLYRTINRHHPLKPSVKARHYVPLQAVNSNSNSNSNSSSSGHHGSLRRRRMSFKTKGSPMMPLLDICEKNKYPYYEALEVEDKDSFVVAAAKGSSSSSSIDIPFAHFIRSATSTSSNHSLSKSQRTHATATTGSFESSSTTANNNHRPAQQTVFQQLQTNPGSNSDYYYTSQQQPSLLLPPLSSCYQTAQQPLLTVTASPSFTESEVSFISFPHHHEGDANASFTSRASDQHGHDTSNNNSKDLSHDEEERQANEQESLQLQFWRRQASACLDQYGIQHCQTAKAFLELGLAHIRCEVRS